MFRFLTISLVILSACGEGCAQHAAAPGTFELQTIEPKTRDVFAAEILIRIEDARHPEEERYLRVGRSTWARIPSRHTILADGFQPLATEVMQVPPEAIPPAYREP